MILPRAASAAAALLSTGVLVPLYIDPGSSCSAWTPLTNSISAHPTVPFYLVINPNSGPGSANSQPPSEYQTCIPKISAYSNVVVLGYVATWEGEASMQAGVATDVNTYANWGAAYKPDGIFFDQTSSSSSALSAYQTFTTHAKSLFDFVTLNPGDEPPSGYFSIADLLLTAEDYYSDFKASQLTLGTTTPPAKQAIVLHDAPSTVSTSLISQLVADKVGAVYFTTDTEANDQNPYDDLPTNLEAFVAALQAAQ